MKSASRPTLAFLPHLPTFSKHHTATRSLTPTCSQVLRTPLIFASNHPLPIPRPPFRSLSHTPCRTSQTRQTRPSSPPSRLEWARSATGVTRSTRRQVRRFTPPAAERQPLSLSRCIVTHLEQELTLPLFGLASHSPLPDRIALHLLRPRRPPARAVAHLGPHLAQDHAARRSRQRPLALHRRGGPDRGAADSRERNC